MHKVIPLSDKRLASSSYDMTVRIWKDNKKSKCIFSFKHDYSVDSILKLRDKEVLVSAYSGGYFSPLSGVSFWNINKYTHQHTIKGYGVNKPTYMIELSNGNIAVSSKNKTYPLLSLIVHHIK